MEPRSAERGNKRMCNDSDALWKASMEPRSAERGNIPMCAQLSGIVKCFNGATLSRTWKRIFVTVARHQPQGFNGATLSRTWKLPSRPGRDRAVSVASMEPRSAERGNLIKNGKCQSCGGRFNGATLSRTWKPFEITEQELWDIMLQWSHAQPNVETAHIGNRIRPPS